MKDLLERLRNEFPEMNIEEKKIENDDIIIIQIDENNEYHISMNEYEIEIFYQFEIYNYLRIFEININDIYFENQNFIENILISYFKNLFDEN